jgi:hypothetical protein
VEYEMKNGLPFNEAYHMVREKMGKRRLKEIQEETLYAVDTKYRKMKNAMKISGVAGTVLLAFAALFKIMHWPGAGIMMTLGALSLAFIFMPSALGVLWKETHSGKRLFLYISAFIAGMFFIMGTVFKIQHWPGAGVILGLAALCGVLFFLPSLLASKLTDQENRSKRIIYFLGAAGLACYILGLVLKIQHWPGAAIFLMTGLFILFFIVFPWYTLITWKEDNNVSARFLFIVIGSIAIVVPSALVSLNVGRNYEGGFYVHQAEQQAMFNYEYNNNRSFLNNYKDSVTYPVLIQIHTRTNDLIKLIQGIESKMIAESEGKPGNPAVISQLIQQTENGPEIQVELLKNRFSTAPFRDFLQQGTASRQELDAALKDYANYISGLTAGRELQKFEKLLDPAVFLNGINPGNKGISLMNGVHMLGLMKNSILTVESNAFLAVSKQ